MADKNVLPKLAFTFLEDVRNTFQQTYSRHDIESARGYQLKSFGLEFLRPKLVAYNENPELFSNKTDKVVEKMNILKDNMVENIENLI